MQGHTVPEPQASPLCNQQFHSPSESNQDTLCHKAPASAGQGRGGKKKANSKAMCTDYRANWGKEKRTKTMCSCLQILLDPLSNEMSLSARWDLNFPSSLAADEQRGSPSDLIIWPWLLLKPVKKKKNPSCHERKEMLFDPIWALFPWKQGVDVYRHAILSHQDQGRVVKETENMERWQGCLKTYPAGSHQQK